MNFRKATINLTQPEIEAACRLLVAQAGYTCGSVTIAASPHQYNGPDTFSATVEVETQRFEGDGLDDPQCTCNTPTRLGKCPVHESPR